jgi:hypothetical protein
MVPPCFDFRAVIRLSFPWFFKNTCLRPKKGLAFWSSDLMARKNPSKVKKRSPPASARPKRAGRIPGVSVGQEVDTSLGIKKKVCFTIGGKWFFRMVDPEWRAPGRPKLHRGEKQGREEREKR